MNSPAYLIAIDAGGTKSQIRLWTKDILEQAAAVRTEGRAADLDLSELSIADFRSAGINLDGISQEEATHRLENLLTGVAQKAGISLEALSQDSELVVGMAGIDTDLDLSQAQEWMGQALGELKLAIPYTIISDVELGLWAATPSGSGIVLIAGTGSNCFGRNAAGQTAKAGGLSHFFSDEGGGFMLGWEALHHVGKMYDGREERTLLFDLILAELEVADFAELKQYIVRASDYKQAVARVAPAVQKASEQGEPLAQELIERAVNDLAAMIEHVFHQLSAEEAMPVYFVGGLFQDGPYKQKLTQLLSQKGIASQEIHVADPTKGAIWYLLTR